MNGEKAPLLDADVPGEGAAVPRDKYAGFEISSSRQFADWLAQAGCSLVFTTYQAGRVFFIGTTAERRLSMFERYFNRAMGLAAQGQTLWLASLYQLWRFENTLTPGETWGPKQYDRLYVPRVGWTTGDVDAHDIGIAADGRPIFVNTLFSCLATVSETHSFVPLWRPPFISRLAAEDRCHLNGLAMVEGKAKYVTVVSRSDVADGWREHRNNGGVIIDVESGEIVCTGLSMPHSPRVHGGRLFVHNSGTGEFGTVDTAAGKFVPLAFCPGYLRGLTFVGNYAVVGLSKPRDGAFTGLALDQALAGKDAKARCGLMVIELKSGDISHWLQFDTVIDELYDVAVLPGTRSPAALGFRNDEVRRVVSVAPGGAL